MNGADEMEAKYRELRRISEGLDADIVRLHESGIARTSPIYQAAEREVHRISDEMIWLTGMRDAVGTAREEVETRYQDLSRRSMRLQEALLAIFDAGIPAGSPIHQLIEAEIDRVGDALNAASAERSATPSNS